MTTAEQFNAALKGIRDLTPRLDVFAGPISSATASGNSLTIQGLLGFG